MIQLKLFLFVYFWSSNLRFLFNWKTPIGYTIAMTFQYVMTWSFCYLYSCLISFTIGTSLTLIAFTNDLVAILKSINHCAQDKENELDIAQKLNVFIKLHSTVKQLGGDHRILQYILLNLFL